MGWKTCYAHSAPGKDRHIIWAPLSGHFLFFYSNLHPSKHETALWSTFSPSDILGKLWSKLLNSLKNLEEF